MADSEGNRSNLFSTPQRARHGRFDSQDGVVMASKPQLDLSTPARWQQRWRVITEKIALAHTHDEELALLRRISLPARPTVVAFANAHAMNTVTHSPAFFQSLHSADWLLRDGSGMRALFKMMGIEPGLNLNGTDLIPKIVHHFDGRVIAFFGTEEPYLQQGVMAAHQYAPKSKFVSAHGFLEFEDYLSLAIAHKPALIVLGMGMPKQEMIAENLRSKLGFPCTIVCGGALIDFLAGRTSRAPVWMRRAGIEWSYRLIMEPKRLFRRYVVGNPAFLMRSIWMAASPTK